MEPWQRLDAATAGEARVMLHACCGSTRWVERMTARRPFGGADALLGAAREEWWALAPDDWREAFTHHPRIGDLESLRARFPSTHHLSTAEQAGVAGAGEDVLTALAEGNRAYEHKFGYIFIVCATGKQAHEMLALLRERLGNDPEKELRIAAEEQARITALRLQAPRPPVTTIGRPAALEERLELVDALRGFALAGVFFINLRFFSLFDFLNDEQLARLPTAPYDGVLLTLAMIFGDGKFISLFSMLFGLGFALQLQRLEARGADATRIYRRRALALLAIGVAHGLFWFGDILRFYAVLGLLLLALRRISTRTLLVVGVVLALGWAFVPPLVGPEAEVAIEQRTFAAFSSPSFLAAFRQNFETDWMYTVRYAGLPVFILGRFLLGCVAGRIGLLVDPGRHRRLLVQLCWLGWIGGVVGTVGIGALGDDESLAGRFFEGVNALGLAVAYACTFTLLFQRDSWRDLLRHLSPVGRMCLTNYLMQTLIAVPLFYGWGLGIGARYGMPGVIVTWTLVYGAQVPLSRWWLQRYYFGPAEWAWRSITYGERQPFRITGAYSPRTSVSAPV